MDRNALTPAADSTMLLTIVPFGGFYDSLWSADMDRAYESHFDYEGDGHIDPRNEDVFLEAINWREAERWYSDAYVDAVREWLKEQHDVEVPSLKFESMDSPREYNFTTDRVFAHISLGDVQRLLAACDLDVLRQVVQDRCTSYDGFISFYDNDVDQWLGKPLVEWDHNELGMILHALVPADRPFDDGFYYHIVEAIRFDEECWRWIDESKVPYTYEDHQRAHADLYHDPNQMDLPFNGGGEVRP